MLLVEQAHRLNLSVMKLPGELCKLLSNVAYVLTVQKTVSVSYVAVYAWHC
jgi:hypothetical protein